MLHLLERAYKATLYFSLVGWRTKAFWLRAGFCWLIAAILLSNEENSSFDLRLKLRGSQPTSDQIVLIELPETAWLIAGNHSPNDIRSAQELGGTDDLTYWQPQLWEKLLQKVLEQKPASVGVTLFFRANSINLNSLTAPQRQLFSDEHIYWAAEMDLVGRILVPAFGSPLNANIAITTLRADEDGIVRRFSSPLAQVPQMGLRLAESLGDKQLRPRAFFQTSQLINFAGTAAAFKSIPFSDVMAGRFSPDTFAGKIVLIGARPRSVDLLKTPLGRMSPVEIHANIVDNTLGDKWALRLPYFFYLSLITAFLAGAIWVLANYPQAVASVSFIWFGLVWAAASAWAFDSLHLWLPVLSPTVTLVFTYIVFLSYHLALKEEKTWRLQAEQKYLLEIEQLKSNFVSMMSHDLKTPIAKIQGIVDHLFTMTEAQPLSEDLRQLRRASADLHRYIQSILKVTKVEARDFQISREVTDMNELIDRVRQSVETFVREKSIRLELTLEPMFSIEADPTLLLEVILNLVENAIKYTPQGGRIVISSFERDNNVTVAVEDNGPGIPAEEQRDIWLKFTRGSLTQATQGSGLGLYLVKYFVELHGGKVFLESEVGRGTKIGFSIPVSNEH